MRKYLTSPYSDITINKGNLLPSDSGGGSGAAMAAHHKRVLQRGGIYVSSEKKTFNLFSWQYLHTLLSSCIIFAVIWIAFHGVPLFGLPKPEQVNSVSIISEVGEIEVSDVENIELLVKSANLLHYRIRGNKEGSPEITLVYHLSDGTDREISANRTTMWWRGKSHPIKETGVFVNIIENLFLVSPEQRSGQVGN